MLKVSTFLAESEQGLAAVPLFGPGDSAFEKTASVGLLPEVSQYINDLRPRSNAQYVLVNAMGAGEFFGCFPEGTLVETAEGEVPIERVSPGVRVRTHKNRFRSVTALLPQQAEELCDLYAQGLPSLLPSLTATPNHELWAITRDDFLRTERRVVWKGDTSTSLEERRAQALREVEFSWIPISDMRAGDYIAEPFPLEEDPCALGDEKWNCPEVAFLMGLYAAEGCTATRSARPGKDHYAVFVISNEEQETLLRARKASSKLDYSLYDCETSETHSIRLELHWQDFARLCCRHVGKLAGHKKLSTALLRMPREWQQVFFEAYAGGDGCVRGPGKEEGTIRCVSASAALLRGVRLLLARLGLVASISGRHNTKATWYAGRPIFELAVSGGQLRGRGTPKSCLHPEGFLLSAVKRVERYEWSGKVYDLSVEEDCSYTASGISVHNSNINGDHFPEAGLIHTPAKATGNHLTDRALAKQAAYGYLTFYGAHPYAHHRNKDPSRAYGEVELALWNDHMKRVELVTRVDHDKCLKFGGSAVWDKLKMGQFPDVSMGCFKAGTRVTMADGTRKNIEDVAPGDRVLTHEGRPRRVRAVQCRPYEGLIYKVKPEAHAPIYCTEKHPFLAVPVASVKAKTAKGYQRWLPDAEVVSGWLPAKDLAQQLLVEPVLRGTLTPDYATKEFCRLLGYYLAEGHVLRNKKKEVVGLQLSTHVDDAVHAEIESLCAAVATQNPPSWADSDSSPLGRYIYVHDRWLANKCLELAGSGAKTKRLAEEVLHWHPEVQAELLGAYANGDGCALRGGALRLSTSNFQLASQLWTILPRLGVAASMQGLTHKAGTGFNRTSTREWVLHVGKQYVGPFVGRCAKVAEQAVHKPKNLRKFYGNQLLTPIREQKGVWEKTEVFNLDVDGDDSYQVGNLAVHNSKVPYDTSSITLDWKLYREAEGTYNPKVHKHPGMAVLEFHKKLKAKNGVGIRGVSITRNDYDEYCRTQMNKILPDGRKVFVYNDYPRFFDISFVFIGADRTAKVMVYIVKSGQVIAPSSASAAEDLGTPDPDSKTASVEEHLLEHLFGKLAVRKEGEIDKKVGTNLPPNKAVPLLTKQEPNLSADTLTALRSVPLPRALSTMTGMGMLLRPHEFQYIADGKDNASSVRMSTEQFMPALARILMPEMPSRSALGPMLEDRMASLPLGAKEELKAPASLSDKPLRKMGAAYKAYRHGVIDLVAHTQNLLESAALPHEGSLHKLASASVDDIFTPLAFEYLTTAFLDEVVVDTDEAVVKTSSQAVAGVQRGSPSRNTW